MSIVFHKYSDVGDGSMYYVYVFSTLKRGDYYWSKEIMGDQYKVLLKFNTWMISTKVTSKPRPWWMFWRRK